jgi:hypothetical protein
MPVDALLMRWASCFTKAKKCSYLQLVYIMPDTAQPRPRATGVYFMIQNAVTFVNKQVHEAVYTCQPIAA